MVIFISVRGRRKFQPHEYIEYFEDGSAVLQRFQILRNEPYLAYGRHDKGGNAEVGLFTKLSELIVINLKL